MGGNVKRIWSLFCGMTDSAWPQQRFEWRPNGTSRAPVIRCNWCGETFSGWPGTYRHRIRSCAATVVLEAVSAGRDTALSVLPLHEHEWEYTDEFANSRGWMQTDKVCRDCDTAEAAWWSSSVERFEEVFETSAPSQEEVYKRLE